MTAALMAMMACSDSDDPIDPGDDDAIAIALSDAALTVLQGASGTTGVTLTRQGGYAGAVDLTVTNLPAGVTAAFVPAQLTGTTSTANLELTAASGATPGAYNLTVNAAGTGVTAATAALTLTIEEAEAGTFELSVEPTSVTVQQGQSAEVTVTADRTGGYTGDIDFSVTGAPTGMTVAFDPETTDENTTTLTVTAGAALAPGTYDLVVTGSSDATGDVTTELEVVVTAASAGGNTTWTFCEAVGTPVWVAARDGDGDWQQVQPDAAGDFAFDVTANGSIAYVLTNNGNAELHVFHGAQSELAVYGGNQCVGDGTTRTVSGSVAGLSDTEQALVSLGSATAFVIPVVSSEFTLEDVPSGELDLLASRLNIDDSGEDPVFEVNRLILRRNVDPADGSTLPVLDFEADESFEPIERALTINNGNGDFLAAISAYVTGNGAVAPFFTGLPAVDGATTYAGVPTDRQQAGDLHFLTVVASPTAEDPTTTRATGLIFAEATDQTVTLGPTIAGVTTEVVDTDPYVRLRTIYTAQAEYASFFVVNYSQTDREATISASTAFTGANVELEIPDFTGVAGWNDDWGLRPGVQTTWFFSASGWTSNGGFDPDLVAGAQFRNATQSGTITP
jgi:hypothetical protein